MLCAIEERGMETIVVVSNRLHQPEHHQSDILPVKISAPLLWSFYSSPLHRIQGLHLCSAVCSGIILLYVPSNVISAVVIVQHASVSSRLAKLNRESATHCKSLRKIKYGQSDN